jgi:hypothetical protein
MNHYYCSVCGTVSPSLVQRLRLLLEPHMSWECSYCSQLSDKDSVEVHSRDLQPCINCQILTKRFSIGRVPMCSTECLVQKGLDNTDG